MVEKQIITVNNRTGKLRRRNNIKETKNAEENIKLKVMMFSNENRRLKRRLQSSMIVESDEELEDETENVSDVLLNNVSPAAKLRAKHKLKLSSPKSPIRKKLHLDKLIVHHRVKETGAR